MSLRLSSLTFPIHTSNSLRLFIVFVVVVVVLVMMVVVAVVGVLSTSCDEAMLRSEYMSAGIFALPLPDTHFLQHAQDSIAVVARQAIAASQQAAGAGAGDMVMNGIAAGGMGHAHHYQHQLQHQLQHQQRERTLQATNERTCCARAVATLRAMARLTHALRTQHCLQLFRDIEMPLMTSVADLEFSGFPVNNRFFRQLAQDLKDRHLIVENLLGRVAVQGGTGSGAEMGGSVTLGGYAAAQAPQMELVQSTLKTQLGQQRQHVFCEEWNKFTQSDPELAKRLSALTLRSTGTVAGSSSVDIARCLVLSQPTRSTVHTGLSLSQQYPPPPPAPYPPSSQPPRLQPPLALAQEASSDGRGQGHGLGLGIGLGIGQERGAGLGHEEGPLPLPHWLRQLIDCSHPHNHSSEVAVCRHPVIHLLKEHWEYVHQLKHLCVSIERNQFESRVRPIYHPNSAKTGRFSSTNPNIQMITKEKKYLPSRRDTLQEEFVQAIMRLGNQTQPCLPGWGGGCGRGSSGGGNGDGSLEMTAVMQVLYPSKVAAAAAGSHNYHSNANPPPYHLQHHPHLHQQPTECWVRVCMAHEGMSQGTTRHGQPSPAYCIGIVEAVLSPVGTTMMKMAGTGSTVTGSNNVFVPEQRPIVSVSSSMAVVASSTAGGDVVVGREGEPSGSEGLPFRVVVRIPGVARAAIWPADQVQRLTAQLHMRQAEQDALNVSDLVISWMMMNVFSCMHIMKYLPLI